MASLIDPDVPQSPHAYTADLRANFAAAKNEIEELQAAVDALGPGGPLDFLPLTGGTLTGPLHLPNGAANAMALQFGAEDGTGFWRAPGNIIGLAVAGSFVVAFSPALAQFYFPVNMLTNRIQQLGDATGAADALNMRTGDARYAPVAMVQQVAELRREVDRLRQLLQRREVTPPAGVGMRTEILAPPT
jgi:hypothetical protein